MFTNLRLFECLWAPLSFGLHVMAKLMCFFVCLFDSIVGLLHGMDEKMFNDFSLENESGFHM